MSNLPSRQVVLAKIAGLREHSESRDEVAAWAFTILDDDRIDVGDREVWTVLELLGAVDLPSTDRAYLYEEEDFAQWEARLK